MHECPRCHRHVIDDEDVPCSEHTTALRDLLSRLDDEQLARLPDVLRERVP